MKIPKKMNILGREFTIKIINQEDIAKITQTPSAVGGMSYSEKLILISKGLTKEDTLLTLIHEVVHASQYITGLNQITSYDLAEVWCETMSNTFLDVIKQIAKVGLKEKKSNKKTTSKDKKSGRRLESYRGKRLL